MRNYHKRVIFAVIQLILNYRIMKLYHGSPSLFDKFELNTAGDGTGLKFGYGVYLTEAEKSAVHYSQPRHQDLTPDHYLYTVEIPDLTHDNFLVSALPVPATIVARVEDKLGQKAPAKVTAKGKEFRQWIGTVLTGAKEAGFAEEKAAAELLDSVGILYNVWPTAQVKVTADMDIEAYLQKSKNIAVFNADNVRIIKREHIEIENKCKKWVLVEGSKQEV